mmetsp:Transcript_5922/g.22449  ORF Transcript_5922/g.22449 Transcript_5922/m.22449 type:complete len:268 (+) Transcript_5922:2141-2944(+)
MFKGYMSTYPTIEEIHAPPTRTLVSSIVKSKMFHRLKSETRYLLQYPQMGDTMLRSIMKRKAYHDIGDDERQIINEILIHEKHAPIKKRRRTEKLEGILFDVKRLSCVAASIPKQLSQQILGKNRKKINFSARKKIRKRQERRRRAESALGHLEDCFLEMGRGHTAVVRLVKEHLKHDHHHVQHSVPSSEENSQQVASHPPKGQKRQAPTSDTKAMSPKQTRATSDLQSVKPPPSSDLGPKDNTTQHQHTTRHEQRSTNTLMHMRPF